MYWKITTPICLGLLALIVLECGRADAQPSTSDEVQRIDGRLDVLRARKQVLEAQLERLAGNSVGVVLGILDGQNRFRMLDGNATPAELEEAILFPTSPERYADFLAAHWLLGDLTTEQVLQGMRAASNASRSSLVRQGYVLMATKNGASLAA